MGCGEEDREGERERERAISGERSEHCYLLRAERADLSPASSVSIAISREQSEQSTLPLAQRAGLSPASTVSSLVSREQSDHSFFRRAQREVWSLASEARNCALKCNRRSLSTTDEVAFAMLSRCVGKQSFLRAEQGMMSLVSRAGIVVSGEQ